MSDRNRVSNYTIAGWVVAGLLLGIVFGQWVTISNLPSGPSSPEPSRTAQKYDGDAKQTSAAGQSQESGAYDPGCPYPKTREDADLCEQRRMAKAAEEAQALAASQWLWNVAQAGATVLAALAAGYAAWAASRSAQVAERALVDLERPYLFVDVRKEPIAGNPSSDKLDAIFPTGEFSFRFVNCGRSPALLTEIEKRFVSVPGVDIWTDWPKPIDPNTEPGESLPIGVIAVPDKDNDRFALRRLTVTESSRLERAKQNLFLIGYVRYRDILGNKYITGFCAVHDREGNRFVLTGDERYNYTRKE